MSVEAKLRYSRISPRKVRLVANLIRGERVDDAEKILRFTVKKPITPLLKLLRSAVANAEHNYSLKKEDLYISEIRVDGGPIIKRFRPRARGSASPIQKKTSHILIVLKEKGGVDEEKEGKKEKIKRIYQEEKPKEDIPKKVTGRPDKEEGLKESPKPVKDTKKQIFRRKSI